MISESILNAYIRRFNKNWDTIYIAVDLHDTIIKGYTGNKVISYDWADEVLQFLSSRDDIALILFTSTYPPKLEHFLNWCESNNIRFKYLNENPECANTDTADFSKKFYYDILLDDKAGFDPESDWLDCRNTFIKIIKMYECPKSNSCIHGMAYDQDSWICSHCNNEAAFLQGLSTEE